MSKHAARKRVVSDPWQQLYRDVTGRSSKIKIWKILSLALNELEPLELATIERIYGIKRSLPLSRRVPESVEELASCFCMSAGLVRSIADEAKQKLRRQLRYGAGRLEGRQLLRECFPHLFFSPEMASRLFLEKISKGRRKLARELEEMNKNLDKFNQHLTAMRREPSIKN